MKNILITGCNGQLGSEMRREAEWHTEFTYFFTDVADLDITDRQAVRAYIRDNRIDCVVNCAAYTAVDKAEEDVDCCDVLNRTAPGYLAEAVNECGGAMIQISTDYVFDGKAYVPYVETDMPNPETMYGSTKLAGEQQVLAACPRSVIIRTAWLYSVYGNNFVKTMIRLGREREDLGVIFDQIGSPTNARDLARTIYVVLSKGIKPGVYHYSNEGVASWYDFTKAIHRLCGIHTCSLRPLHTDEYPTLAVRPHYSVLDKTKIKQTYQIDIPHWEESLAGCLSELLA